MVVALVVMGSYSGSYGCTVMIQNFVKELIA